MAFTRGSKDDFDRWANVTEDEGWSWNSLQPYIRKVFDVIAFLFVVEMNILQMEKLVPPTDGRDITGEVDPSVHGHKGITAWDLTH